MTNIKKNRSQVTGVTVKLVDPNGKPRTVKIDPTVTKALFWDEKCVLEILAPFYETQSSEMTSQKLSSSFGSVGKKIAGSQKKVKLTKEVIKKLWEEEDDNGNLPALLAKTFLCDVDLPGGSG